MPSISYSLRFTFPVQVSDEWKMKLPVQEIAEKKKLTHYLFNRPKLSWNWKKGIDNNTTTTHFHFPELIYAEFAIRIIWLSIKYLTLDRKLSRVKIFLVQLKLIWRDLKREKNQLKEQQISKSLISNSISYGKSVVGTETFPTNFFHKLFVLFFITIISDVFKSTSYPMLLLNCKHNYSNSLFLLCRFHVINGNVTCITKWTMFLLMDVGGYFKSKGSWE